MDKRDFSYLPNYRDDDRDMLSRYTCGELPKQGWINAMALVDNVATYLQADLVSHTSLAATAYKNLKQLEAHTSSDHSDQTELKRELTDCESAEFQLMQTVAQTIVLLQEGNTASSSKEAKTMSELMEVLNSRLTSSLNERREKGSSASTTSITGIPIVTWEEIHASLTQLESLHVITTFLTWISKKQKGGGKVAKAGSLASVSKETISELQSLVAELEAQIHNDARTMKSAIDGPGVLGKLVDLGMARQRVVDDDDGDDSSKVTEWMWDGIKNREEWESLMDGLCDEVTMETICERMRESWDDTLDGVLMRRKIAN